MTKKAQEETTLQQRLKETTQQFLQLNEQRTKITEELLRLQGEARLLEKLIKMEKENGSSTLS